jgi:putative oxidoreductase
MPTDLSSTLLLLARVLMGGAFVLFGLRNFRNFQKMRPGMAEKKVPLPDVALAIGLLLQTLGGALVLLGIFTPWGAAAIILFLILATLMYHPFWGFAGEERTPHLNAFIINSALIGGALAIMSASL